MSGQGAEDRPGLFTRLLSWPFELLITGYRRWVSPAMPASCRFYPSCSTYALTSVRRFGPFVGGWLTVRRLLRCHPWNPGGVDHVPTRGVDGRLDWSGREGMFAAAPADTCVSDELTGTRGKR